MFKARLGLAKTVRDIASTINCLSGSPFAVHLMGIHPYKSNLSCSALNQGLAKQHANLKPYILTSRTPTCPYARCPHFDRMSATLLSNRDNEHTREIIQYHHPSPTQYQVAASPASRPAGCPALRSLTRGLPEMNRAWQASFEYRSCASARDCHPR